MPTRFFRVPPPRSGIASNGNIARVKIYIHMHITTRIVIILAEVDTTINQQREEHECSQLFPYAECVSRSRTEAVWIFKFFVLFYFLIFIYSHSPRARARSGTFTMTRSLGIRTFIRWIRRSKAEEVGREIVNRISLRSIKHPTLPPPLPLSSNNNIGIHRTD